MLKPLSRPISKALDPAWFRESHVRPDLEKFRTELSDMFGKVRQGESEEHFKGYLKDFLQAVWYRSDYAISPKGRIDLAIHLGQNVDVLVDSGSVLREFGLGAQVLVEIGLGKVRLLTNKPRRIAGLEGYGLEVVEQLPTEKGAAPHPAE